MQGSGTFPASEHWQKSGSHKKLLTRMKSLSWIEPQIPIVSVGSARYLRYRVGPTPSSTKSPLKTSEGKPWLQHRGVESMRASGEDDVISTVVEGSSSVHPRLEPRSS
ncbi:hypothetical protein B296_00053875 [Ensete ventricosum]|uniref:Uncharacterized protein n=1 Tax=Ensete ventricosum TaxID=4639 RepID=A0A426X381_ENSVE|nr:hypothetical protein B296_00053875 [Ensete ventricosum]